MTILRQCWRAFKANLRTVLVSASHTYAASDQKLHPDHERLGAPIHSRMTYVQRGWEEYDHFKVVAQYRVRPSDLPYLFTSKTIEWAEPK